MNLFNFHRKSESGVYKKLEDNIQLSLSMNDMPLIAMTILSIAQANIEGKIDVKDTSNLFSKYLPFTQMMRDSRIREIIEMGSCITTNQDPDENVRRIRDMIKTF